MPSSASTSANIPYRGFPPVPAGRDLSQKRCQSGLSCQPQLTLEVAALQPCLTRDASPQPPQLDAGTARGWILKAGILAFPSLPLHPGFPNSSSVSRHSEHQEVSTQGWGRGLRAAGTPGLCHSARREQCGCVLVFARSALCWGRVGSPGRTSHVQGGCSMPEQRSYWMEHVSPKPSSSSLLLVEGADEVLAVRTRALPAPVGPR